MNAKTPTQSLERKISQYDQLNPDHGDIPATQDQHQDSINSIEEELPPSVPNTNTNTNPSPPFIPITDKDIVLANELVKSTVSCISNLIYKHKKCQDLLRFSHSLPVILNQCHTNMNNPFLREYSLMCIRNACEDNIENQQVIESYRQASK